MKKTLVFILLVTILTQSTQTSDCDFIFSEEDLLFIKKVRRQKEINNFNFLLRLQEPGLFLLAMRESARPDRGDTIPNYHAWNTYGFVGAWQINIKYMEYLEIAPFTMDEFLSDPDQVFPPELQLIAVKRLIEKNKHYLKDYWHYVGKKIKGIDITEDGIIFAAHLAGHRGVKNFFNYGRDPSDANGTRLTDYLNYQKTFY